MEILYLSFYVWVYCFCSVTVWTPSLCVTGRKFHRTTTTSLPTAPGSAEVPTTTSGSRHETTATVHLTTTDVNGPPSESSIKLSAVSREPQTVSASSRSPINPDTGSHLSTTGEPNCCHCVYDCRGVRQYGNIRSLTIKMSLRSAFRDIVRWL